MGPLLTGLGVLGMETVEVISSKDLELTDSHLWSDWDF
jgi:hypothetical protein